MLAALVLAAVAANSLDAVSVYQGTWDAHLTYVQSRYSKARDEHHTITNDCWRSGDYYACHQIVDGASAALIVYTYDAKNDTFYTHPVASGDTPANAGTLKIDGATWTYPWTQTDAGKTVYFRVVNTFEGHDAITFRQEYSNDGTTWTVIATGTEHRLR